jgi:N6-adenosine-specific RNA methylase IME4
LAEGLGVDHKTVATVRREAEGTGEIPQLDKTVGADGKERRKPIRTAFVDPTPEGQKAALDSAKEIRAEKAAQSRTQRLERIEQISRGNAELDVKTRYPVIYADPPWRYENPPMGGGNRSIENHYPTMTLEEICAMPVSELASPDAMLYLWATAPKLIECLEVVNAWGFEYRTNMVWDKVKIGMGYHARNQHEILLICRRGNIPPPAAGTQPPSIYREARGAHSAKPLFFYEMIEAAYPNLPKIELFNREYRRPGWDVWGNQAGVAA